MVQPNLNKCGLPLSEYSQAWSSDGDSVSSESFSLDSSSPSLSPSAASESDQPYSLAKQENGSQSAEIAGGANYLSQAGVFSREEVIEQAIDRWTLYVRLCKRALHLLRETMVDRYVQFAVDSSKPTDVEKPVKDLNRRRSRALASIRRLGRYSVKTENQRRAAALSRFAIVSTRLAPWRNPGCSSGQCKYRDPTTTTWERPCLRASLPLLPFCASHLVQSQASIVAPGVVTGTPTSEGSPTPNSPSVVLDGEGGTVTPVVTEQSGSESKSASKPCSRSRVTNQGASLSSGKVTDFQCRQQNSRMPADTYAPDDVLLVSGCRTPIGRFCGSLAKFSAHELGGYVIADCLRRAQFQFTETNDQLSAGNLKEVVMGQVYTAGAGQNPARQAAVAAGVPYCVPAWGVNMLCASGLKAVCLCAANLKTTSGMAVAGGQEVMSRCPHVTRNGCSLRRGGGGGNASQLPSFGDFSLADSLLIDGLQDAFSDYLMGDTAENIARIYEISREQQDVFAFSSQMKCKKARESGLSLLEIVPIRCTPLTNQELGKPEHITADEIPRPLTTLESLSRLKPMFSLRAPPGHQASVTAGNCSPLSDGAAALLLCRADLALQMGIRCPLGRIVGWQQSGCEPEIMGLGPIYAVRGLLQNLSWSLEDVDLFELNEAFASQSLAVIADLHLPEDRLNASGGAIALGHPLGCSGARILVTLIYNLHRRAHDALALGDTRETWRGIAALCVGGGMGMAIAVELLTSHLVAISECPVLCSLRQLHTANCERTFVQRDFSEGTGVRFQVTPLPPRLAGKISHEEFAKAISELNELFDEAESLSAGVICENFSACIFAYLLFLCMPTHYERMLEKIAYRVIQLNDSVFVPKGLLMIDPAERGLRVIEICILNNATP